MIYSQSTIWRFVAHLFIVWLLSVNVYSADTDNILRVGVQDSPPYVLVENGTYRGIAYDLWAHIADHLGLKFKIVPMGEDTTSNLLALKNKQIDVYIGPVTITHERSLIAEFSRPYAVNTIEIAVPVDERSTWDVLRQILKEVFTITLLGALALLFIYINAIWFFEHGRIPDVPTSYLSGISYVFWVTLLKKSALPDLPTTYIGKVIYFLWISGSTIIISILYATVASTFHLSFSENTNRTSADFVNKQLIAVKGSAGLEYAKDAGLNVTTVKDLQTGLDMVAAKTADGFVGHSATMYYYIRKNNLQKEIMLAPWILKTGILSFAFRVGDPLIPKIDSELSYLDDFNLTRAMCERYLDRESARNCF